MGDMADAYNEGLYCTMCAVIFVKEHGHPVLCKDCYADQDENPDEFPCATEKEVYDGINTTK